eukprot:668890-Pelagomonas_calceolata.AAC.5
MEAAPGPPFVQANMPAVRQCKASVQIFRTSRCSRAENKFCFKSAGFSANSKWSAGEISATGEFMAGTLGWLPASHMCFSCAAACSGPAPEPACHQTLLPKMTKPQPLEVSSGLILLVEGLRNAGRKGSNKSTQLLSKVTQ